MKRLPSTGFVCLILTLFFFSLFFLWVVSKGWYDRIYSSEEDLAKWASYLEEVAVDFPNNKKRIEIYKEAADLRSRLGQPEKTVTDLEKASQIDPEDDITRARIILEKYRSGQSREAVKLAKSRFDNGKRDWETLSILISDQIENPNPGFQNALIEAIENGNIAGKQFVGNGKVIMLGFSPDHWTLNGKPGYVLVKDPGEKKEFHKLVLECYADGRVLPLTASIEDGYRKFSHTFNRPGRLEIDLPKAGPDGKGFFVVKTDKTWTPPTKDQRKLGVRVTLSD